MSRQKQASAPAGYPTGAPHHDSLVGQERLAVLGQLAAGLAHEIRNPLTSIRGFCQLLDSLVTDEKSRAYLKILVHEVDRMNGLIAEFMALARPRTPEIGPLDLNDLLRETLAVTESRCFLSGVTVRVQTEALPPVPADRDKVKQVLLNLINNAIEAMEDQNREKVLTVSTEKDGQAVRVVISDTGCGIPKDLMGNIGRPFFSTKSNGTGLGLSICRRIMDEHGGTITIESGDGFGTTVTVSLPLAAG